MPSEHARLNPSAAERWLNCPGSIALSDQCPPAGTTDYAEEGTRAHAVAEAKLRFVNKEITLNGMRNLIKPHEPDGEMDEATDYYRDAVTEIYYSAGNDAELLIEQKFTLDKWVPGGFGTSDAVVIGGGVINVIDLKYGKGIRVDAEDNPQLRLYALGAVNMFESLYDFDTVRMTIVQPRLDHISTAEMSLNVLVNWADTVVKPTAKRAAAGCNEITAGDWCRFCPAKAVCRIRAEYNLETERLKFKDPALLDNDEVGDVLTRGTALKTWLKDVEDHVLRRALEGEHFDGWKLVEGRSNRKITDEIEAVKKLTAAGMDEALLYERKFYGITQLEKNVGKKKLSDILGKLIDKPAGKPTLVPESDKRKPINPAAKAADDFKED